MRASVLGHERALSGHMYLGEDGRVAYLADGEQVVGRGVGHWVRSSGVTGIDLQVYQYGAAEVNVPERPHRFKAVWAEGSGPIRGEWYFCPEDGSPPRLVGNIEADRTSGSLEQLVPKTPFGSLPAAPRKAVFSALEAKSARRSKNEQAVASILQQYKVGNLASMYYIPEWIDEEQEGEFIRMADSDVSQWDRMGSRSSQEWGAGDRCGCGRGLRREPLPPQLQKVADAVHTLGAFDASLFPMNSVRINAYTPGQGIYPHCDGPVYYPKVGILSMGSPCLFHFYPKVGNEDTMKWNASQHVPAGHREGDVPVTSVLVEPRSLLLFGQDTFWHHRHAIDATSSEKVTSQVCNLKSLEGRYEVGDVVNRTRRVSLTLRHLLPRCACQG